MGLSAFSSLKLGILLTLFLVILVGCNKDTEPVALAKQEEQEKAEEKKLPAKAEGKEDSSDTTSTLNNLIDSGFNLWDKAESMVDSVSSSIGNTISLFDSDVRKVKKMEYTEDGFTITLEDLFNGTLDNPKWKSKEDDGINLVMITGGGSKFIKSLDAKSNPEQGLNQFTKKTKEVTVFLPVHKGQVFLKSVGYFVEIPEVGMMPMPSPGIFSELLKTYLSEHAKK